MPLLSCSRKLEVALNVIIISDGSMSSEPLIAPTPLPPTMVTSLVVVVLAA